MTKHYIESQFVTYEIALKLKELSFDEECLKWGNGTTDVWAIEINLVKNSETWLKDFDCTLPLWQQAIDWLRKEYNIYISILPHVETEHGLKVRHGTASLLHGGYSSYEEAREQAILKAIELINKDEK